MYIVADIGGTKTRVAAVRDLERFEEPIIFDSSPDDSVFIEMFTKTVQEIIGDDRVERMVVGKPHWRRRPTISEEIKKSTQAEVVFENDTALVGLGEATFGAGRDASIFVYITVSTGVNGVRVTNGSIDTSRQGFEIGGQYLTSDTSLSWEEMISGRAVTKKFGVNPKELGKEHPVWEELALVTALGLHNTILHWSPDRVALGGSMMNEIGIPIDRIRTHTADMMRKFEKIPEIVHSELGDLGGLYGGLALLRQGIKG